MFINRSLVGRSVESVIGTALEDLVAPQRKAISRHIFDQVLATGEGQDFESVLIVPETGEVRAVEVRLRPVLADAQLALPPDGAYLSTGKRGIHSEHMGYLLAEMQHLQRAFPGGVW